MKPIIVFTIAFICVSCSTYTPCCDTYDFHFPQDTEYQMSYKFIRDVLCNPDKIFSFESDVENCSEYARENNISERFLDRQYYLLTEYFQCNTVYKEEVFIKAEGYQPVPGIIIKLRNSNDDKIEFHFIKEYGKWKFDAMYIGNAVL